MNDKSMKYTNFCLAWKSRFPDIDIPEIWVGNVRENLEHHKAKLACLR